MGKSLSIHPITIIFVLLTAGSLFGVPGVILGIPGYAIFKVLVTHLFKLFKRAIIATKMTFIKNMISNKRPATASNAVAGFAVENGIMLF